MIAKLLNNETAILILQLLSKKPLLLSQLIESLHEIESQNIVAVLGELYRFRLVNQITRNDAELEQKSSVNLNSAKKELEITRITLGLHLSDYISFWEDLPRDKNQDLLNEYDHYYYSLPQHIKEKIINCDLKEIPGKILGSKA